MPELKYKVIANKSQYYEYCKTLETLVFSGNTNTAIKDEIDLLTLLIEKWDAEHKSFTEVDPIQLLQSLMKDHKLKAVNLVEILGVSKGYVSEMLHYKKGLSKDAVRILAAHFKLSQEAFNRPYPLLTTAKSKPKTSKARKPQKRSAAA
jgi:HTH-type transcriptional regulator/antitoxin HigA